MEKENTLAAVENAAQSAPAQTETKAWYERIPVISRFFSWIIHSIKSLFDRLRGKTPEPSSSTQLPEENPDLVSDTSTEVSNPLKSIQEHTLKKEPELHSRKEVEPKKNLEQATFVSATPKTESLPKSNNILAACAVQIKDSPEGQVAYLPNTVSKVVFIDPSDKKVAPLLPSQSTIYKEVKAAVKSANKALDSDVLTDVAQTTDKVLKKQKSRLKLLKEKLTPNKPKKHLQDVVEELEEARTKKIKAKA